MSIQQNLIVKDSGYFRQGDNKTKTLMGLFSLGAVAIVGFIALSQQGTQQKDIVSL